MNKNEKIFLNPDERLDDLQRENLFVIQNKNHYCFSIDSVLLSDFVKVKHNEKALELCSGCGVISILVRSKCHPQSIVGVELDESLYDMSLRSLKYNNIADIFFVNMDLKDFPKSSKCQHKFDVVFSNPPYLKKLANMESVSLKFHSTKYETATCLEDILLTAKSCLKTAGRFYLIYSAPRLQELLSCAKKHELYLKTIQFIYFKQNASSPLVQCEFIKNVPQQAEVIAPLVL